MSVRLLRCLLPCLVLLVVASFASIAAAEGVRAAVRADETKAVVGDVVTVEFEISRTTRGNVPTPELPDSLSGAFKVGRCDEGRSRVTNVLNGRVVTNFTRTKTCALEAKTPGKHKIAFTAKDGRTKVASNTITIEVLAKAAERAPLEDPTVVAPTDAREDVFLWVSTDKRRAYVGEQITFRLDVYEGRRFVDASLRTTPTFEGFTSDELPLPELYTTLVGERPFRVRPGMRRALFAQRSGKATIGAAELLIARRKRRFSDKIELDILPLPTEGRPAGFSANNVGRYSLSAAVDRTEVQPGEPFTLTYTIEGEGNIDIIDPGKWPELPSTRSYDPKVTTERIDGDTVGGKRSYAFLMIPERSGTLEVPAHTFAYFDPNAEAYGIAKSEAIEIVVGGDPNAIVPDPEAEPVDEAPTIEEPLAPVVSVTTVPRGTPRDRWLSRDRWSTGMLIVPLLTLLGLGGAWAWRRFGPDDAQRARARSRARRRERIEAAQQGVESGDGFHGAVSSLLQGVALDRAGPEGVGLPRPDLIRLLEKRGVSADDRRRLEALLDRCDEARFGAGTGSVDDRHALLEESLDAVRSIAKEDA